MKENILKNKLLAIAHTSTVSVTKECNEKLYWLELLEKTEYISEQQYEKYYY